MTKEGAYPAFFCILGLQKCADSCENDIRRWIQIPPPRYFYFGREWRLAGGGQVPPPRFYFGITVSSAGLSGMRLRRTPNDPSSPYARSYNHTHTISTTTMAAISAKGRSVFFIPAAIITPRQQKSRIASLLRPISHHKQRPHAEFFTPADNLLIKLPREVTRPTIMQIYKGKAVGRVISRAEIGIIQSTIKTWSKVVRRIHY